MTPKSPRWALSLLPEALTLGLGPEALDDQVARSGADTAHRGQPEDVSPAEVGTETRTCTPASTYLCFK